MTTMARKECSYGAEKLSPRQKTWISAAEILCPRRKKRLFRCGNRHFGAKNLLFRCGNRHFEAKSLLFRCSEAPPEAQNSDLRHGNRDSSNRGTLNSYNFENNFSIILSEATTKTSGRSSTSKLQENYFRKF